MKQTNAFNQIGLGVILLIFVIVIITPNYIAIPVFCASLLTAYLMSSDS